MPRQFKPRAGLVRTKPRCTKAPREQGLCRCPELKHYAMVWMRDGGRWVEKAAGHFEVSRCSGRYRNGTRRCRCGTENKALTVAQEVQAKMHAGVEPNIKVGRRERVSLDNYFVTWSAERHGESTTKRGWHHHYYADISPHFGRMTVDEILTEHIQTWVSTHLEKRRIGCGTIEAKIAAAACGARSTRQSQSRNARCSGAS